MHRPENLSDKRSDTLYENERRSPLSILKPPPKQPKAVTIQARVEESVKAQLELYAEFIDASPSYVIHRSPKVALLQGRRVQTLGRTTRKQSQQRKSQRRVLAVPTGMRRGEVLATQWCDVDFGKNNVEHPKVDMAATS